MVEVALLGASGSGKSKLGVAVVNQFYGEDKDPFDALVDDIPENLGAFCDMPYGVFGDMYVNQWIHFARETQEGQSRVMDVPLLVTCGTIIDTICHAHVYMEQFDDAIPSKNMQFLAEIGMLGYQQLIVWGATQFKKDLVYILPLKEPQGDQADYDKRVNDRLMEMNITAKLRFPILDGSHDSNISRVMEDINALQHDGSDDGGVSDQSGRNAEEDSGAGGHADD